MNHNTRDMTFPGWEEEDILNSSGNAPWTLGDAAARAGPGQAGSLSALASITIQTTQLGSPGPLHHAGTHIAPLGEPGIPTQPQTQVHRSTDFPSATAVMASATTNTGTEVFIAVP